MSKKDNSYNKQIVSLKTSSPVAEAFRTLRTNIQFSSLDQDIKTILVTSPQPKDGKSTVVANLGVTKARSGGTVLLVDGDLRKPTLHKLFNISNLVGLTNYIIEEDLHLQEVVQTTFLENLFVMTSGAIPPNPAELLGTRRMKETLQELRDTFDTVIIDSPPVVAVSDSSIISSMSDATLLVLGHGDSNREAALKAKEQLELAQANFLGVVMNKVPLNGQGYYYYYYYGGYGQEDKKNKRSKKRRKK
ncbi:MAG: polysaccharide biosynthesis tyrosine autokinase [Candidatus Syntrophonatronum acetioxidans]|uniref:non-specific protein-tyrosine kinase n=1 Tax=Candidatus Syntrophonatronum acetioxidans TaxID=1795816 RepID=A0A424YC63_9FIRM|nr:MAG: polysaccharide biosynthesis tyrosine autokinase [Candidatus Syntrophonatronum acetioxidans]